MRRRGSAPVLCAKKTSGVNRSTAYPRIFHSFSTPPERTLWSDLDFLMSRNRTSENRDLTPEQERRLTGLRGPTRLGYSMLLRDRAMRAWRPRARTTLVMLALAVSAAFAAAPTPAWAADALLYRIFLRDGSTLVSYGDFARVADRVVFSIPIGGLDGPSPALRLVSISESSVDWERTDRICASDPGAPLRGDARRGRLRRLEHGGRARPP